MRNTTREIGAREDKIARKLVFKELLLDDHSRIPPLRNTGAQEVSHDPSRYLENLILDSFSLRRFWLNPPAMERASFGGLRRLILTSCDHVMALPWRLLPQSLEVLEIVDPVQTFPIRSGQLLNEDGFREMILHFSNLIVLNIQNVGGPICEVLPNLCESGKRLEVLRLHDQEVSGMDQCYEFQRNRGDETIECNFVKLLVHICPNLRELSIDISSLNPPQDPSQILLRRSDDRSTALEPVLGEMALYPTLSVHEGLRSFESLRFLELKLPSEYIIRSEDAVMDCAQKVWTSKMETFTLISEQSSPSDYDELHWSIKCRKASQGNEHGPWDLYLVGR